MEIFEIHIFSTQKICIKRQSIITDDDNNINNAPYTVSKVETNIITVIIQNLKKQNKKNPDSNS